MSVEVSSDRIDTSRQVCPICGLPPNHDVTRNVRGVIICDLICGLTHRWLVKWVPAA